MMCGGFLDFFVHVIVGLQEIYDNDDTTEKIDQYLWKKFQCFIADIIRSRAFLVL